MKKYKIFWTESAALDLNEIFDYIKLDSSVGARKIFDKICKQCESLRNHPERSKIVEELTDVGISTYRQTLANRYRIIFRINDNAIYIVAVLDCRRNLQSLLLHRLLRT